MNSFANNENLQFFSPLSEKPSLKQNGNIVADWPKYYVKATWFPWHRMTRLLTHKHSGPELDDLKIRYYGLKAESVINRPDGLALFKSLDTVKGLLY
jgi:hypothetical protein